MEVSYLEAIALQKHEIICFRMGVLRDEVGGVRGIFPLRRPSILAPSCSREIKSQKCKCGSVFCVRKHYSAFDSK